MGTAKLIDPVGAVKLHDDARLGRRDALEVVLGPGTPWDPRSRWVPTSKMLAVRLPEWKPAA